MEYDYKQPKYWPEESCVVVDGYGLSVVPPQLQINTPEFSLEPPADNVYIRLGLGRVDQSFCLNAIYSKYVWFIRDAPSRQGLRSFFVLLDKSENICGVFTQQFEIPAWMEIPGWYWSTCSAKNVEEEEEEEVKYDSVDGNAPTAQSNPGDGEQKIIEPDSAASTEK